MSYGNRLYPSNSAEMVVVFQVWSPCQSSPFGSARSPCSQTFQFGILLLLAGLNYHSPDVVPYLLAVWAIVIIDAGIRAITTRLCVPILKPLPGVQSTLFSVPYGKRGYFAGSHIRVRVIKGFGWKSTLESHPFTIASEEGAPTLDLIIKDAGDWTHRLFQAAERGEQLRCSIEGPYGESSRSLPLKCEAEGSSVQADPRISSFPPSNQSSSWSEDQEVS